MTLRPLFPVFALVLIGAASGFPQPEQNKWNAINAECDEDKKIRMMFRLADQNEDKIVTAPEVKSGKNYYCTSMFAMMISTNVLNV